MKSKIDFVDVYTNARKKHRQRKKKKNCQYSLMKEDWEGFHLVCMEQNRQRGNSPKCEVRHSKDAKNIFVELTETYKCNLRVIELLFLLLFTQHILKTDTLSTHKSHIIILLAKDTLHNRCIHMSWINSWEYCYCKREQ
jgi:hypothetical protein